MWLEKVTAKALWKVIRISRNQFRYQPVLKYPTAREVYFTTKKEKENAQDIISS